MRLTAQILNTDAVLNNYQVVGVFEFLPGETKTLQLKLFDEEQEIRYTPETGTTMDVTFNTTTGTLVKSGVLNTDDRSMVSVALDASDTNSMIGGSFTFTLTKGADIKKGIVKNGIRKITSDC